ncbi:MAG TPA: pyridoxal phosphate-dependent aminotransferase [Anaeromyxobacteraceae bacterium]|nr:pyridoxal phosphate-dependent aminotransferase [Anaeromyxobacteraceae bacterium]
MLSRRTAWDLSPNRLARRQEELRAAGRDLLDLAESNPTRCGLAWPAEELNALLADPRVSTYEPTPEGLPDARAAVAEYLLDHGAEVPPDRVLLTSSTSEAYALLFKLLCDPGDEVLVPAPSYPLLDLLAGLESVTLARYPLRYDGEWHLDRGALAAAVGPRTRALVAVSPSNPTGYVLGPDDLAFLEAFCAERNLALLGDEVFLDTAGAPRVTVASARGCLAFHLSGLSKVCGLPQLKAGWIAAAGPEPLVRPALERLEVVADTWLSVSAPAQLALPALLARRERFLAPLRARLEENRRAAAREAAGAPFDLLRSRGGWAAVLRLGEAVDEEAVCLALLEEGVVAQPGFFYDFERNGHLVISLLPDPARFADGISRIGAVLRYKRAQ